MANIGVLTYYLFIYRNSPSKASHTKGYFRLFLKKTPTTAKFEFTTFGALNGKMF